MSEGSVDWQLLDANTVALYFTLLLETVEIGHNVLGESVFTGNENSLATSKLETSSVKGLSGVFNEVRFGSDGDENLIDGDTSSLNVRLTEGLAHTLLESISSSAGEHLVDADGVPWVDTDSHVESVLTSLGSHVLVGSDTG
jgi:hypothetical protein